MINVLEILKLGLPGLVFLLALFSYRLLSKEQEKQTPCPDILKTIKQYMCINVALALLTFASPFASKLIFSNSQEISLQALSDFTEIPQVPTESRTINEGIATVCKNADYTGTYLLVKDNITKKLVQVFAGKVMPCNPGQQLIVLKKSDAINLGWESSSEPRNVNVLSAEPGYKFSI